MQEHDIALGSEWIGKVTKSRYQVAGLSPKMCTIRLIDERYEHLEAFSLAKSLLLSDYTPVERPFQVGDIVNYKTRDPKWLCGRGEVLSVVDGEVEIRDSGTRRVVERRPLECTLHISVDDLPDNSGRKTNPPRVDVVTPTVASIMAMPQVYRMEVDMEHYDGGEVEYTVHVAPAFVVAEAKTITEICLNSLVQQLEALKDNREYEIHYEVYNWSGVSMLAESRHDTFEEAAAELAEGGHIRAFKAYV